MKETGKPGIFRIVPWAWPAHKFSGASQDLRAEPPLGSWPNWPKPYLSTLLRLGPREMECYAKLCRDESWAGSRSK